MVERLLSVFSLQESILNFTIVENFLCFNLGASAAR